MSAALSTTLQRLSAELSAVPGLRIAVLFGSAAAGRMRADSDFDIAVSFVEDGSKVDDLALQGQLSLIAEREVDLVRLETASTILRWQIATTGVPLAEARPGGFARLRAEAASEHADFAPLFDRYAEKFRARLVQAGGAE